MSTCPDCTKPVTVPDNARVASIVVCGACSAELEIVGVGPYQLALAPEIEEDFGE